MAYKSDEARRAYAREWYHRNKDKPYFKWNPSELRRANKRKRDRENYDPEKQKLKNAKFKESNPDYSKEWYQNNKDAHCARTRARSREVYVPHPEGSPGSKRYEARLVGFRSGFERTLDTQLRSSEAEYRYEDTKIPYILDGIYNPDFHLLSSDIFIEAKGVLTPEDRRKLRAVKDQHPEIDLRLVFMNAQGRISHGRITNAEWARRNGFVWADGIIPEEWLNE